MNEHDVAEQILCRRETAGLRAVSFARIGLACLLIALVFSAPVPRGFMLVIGSLLIFSVVLNTWLAHKVTCTDGLTALGLAGVATDVFIIAIASPVIQALTLQNAGVSPVYVTKTLAPLMQILFVAINALALRPVYPAVIAGACTMTNLIFFSLAMMDPSIPWEVASLEVLKNQELTQFFVLIQTVVVTVVFAVIVVVTRYGRRMILEAAREQGKRHAVEQQQATSVLDARLGTMAQLVTNVSHEMNTPLGALRSSVSTLKTAVQRLRDRPAGAETQGGRYYKAADQGLATAEQAIERIDTTLSSLRNFAHLDEASQKPVDVNLELKHALSMVPASLRDSHDVVEQYEDVPTIMADPARVGQVFLTVLKNAFEALDEPGTVTLTSGLSDDQVVVTITDCGRGIDARDLEQLFSVQLRTKGSRIAGGYGMAAAQSTIRQLGGDIRVQSRVRRGTTVLITFRPAT